MLNLVPLDVLKIIYCNIQDCNTLYNLSTVDKNTKQLSDNRDFWIEYFIHYNYFRLVQNDVDNSLKHYITKISRILEFFNLPPTICKYKFTRGVNKGQLCNKICKNGNYYCNHCI